MLSLFATSAKIANSSLALSKHGFIIHDDDQHRTTTITLDNIVWKSGKRALFGDMAKVQSPLEDSKESIASTLERAAKDASPRLTTDPKDSEPAAAQDDAMTETQKASPAADPPLPDEAAPPLPAEAPPDDGWAAMWDDTQKAFYFHNRFTNATQWTNPRVPEDAVVGELAPGTSAPLPAAQSARPAGGYDPSIHGDYDPNAWYAQGTTEETTGGAGAAGGVAADASELYAATGQFNRFTGRWQHADLTAENFNDENKSRRQMGAYFDVDSAANSHDGRSLKAERSSKKLSKRELKDFKEKRKMKKEEKRRAWLRD